jgi:hypothetical protein
MSKWPDGFDVWLYHGTNGWLASIQDNRRVMNLSGYTTRQEAELAALDWIQRRIGVPETVPQPVLRNCLSWQFERDCIEDRLEKLWSLEHMLPRPVQAEYTSDAEHTAAADCWQYRCGLIEALRQSLQAERDLIREKLCQEK